MKIVCCFNQSKEGDTNTAHAHKVNNAWVKESFDYKENDNNISHGCCTNCLGIEKAKFKLSNKK